MVVRPFGGGGGGGGGTSPPPLGKRRGGGGGHPPEAFLPDARLRRTIGQDTNDGIILDLHGSGSLHATSQHEPC